MAVSITVSGGAATVSSNNDKARTYLRAMEGSDTAIKIQEGKVEINIKE